jgi:hypothetical protein
MVDQERQGKGWKTMKAENRAQFEAVWKEHFVHCRLLANSLPLGKEALEFLEVCKKLDEYVEKASDFVYGPAPAKVKKAETKTLSYGEAARIHKRLRW